MPQQYRNIAIINYNHIGDLICTIPLLHYCREHMPQAKITLFARPRNKILQPFLADLCDTVISLQLGEDKVSRWQKYITLIAAGLKYRNKFDLVICGLEPRKITNIFIKLLGGHSIAYSQNNWHGRLIKQRRLFTDADKLTRHDALYQLQILAPEYQELPEKWRPVFKVAEPVYQQNLAIITNKLASIIKHDAILVLISVSNNRVSSTIAIEKYAEILNKFQQQQPIKIAISYLGVDTAHAQQLQEKLAAPAVPILTSSFMEFITLIKYSDLIFTGDGGIMHCAAALDKPQLALFGSTDPREWHPLSARAEYLRHHETVNKISTNTIVAALSKLII